MTARTTRRKTVACVGGGVIGAGWAARFALAGMNAVVYDPNPAAVSRAKTVWQNARRARRNLLPSVPEDFGEVRFVSELSRACAGADFAQESAPEREDAKRELLREMDANLPPEVVIASSTSGLRPSRLQSAMQHPERLCVGHPFNPVYLLPLVEVCGGEKTSATTIADAENFYRESGMRPLVVRRETDGFIADRLMEALWREALWLVNDDIATAGEVDDAVRFGCGLRWSFMGTFLTFRLAGGDDGMRHFLNQFGPALKLPWTKLMDTPELSEALIEKIVAQSDAQVVAQARGKTPQELERLRDDCLVAVMKSLRVPDSGAGFGAGEFLNATESSAKESSTKAGRRVPDSDDWSRPLCLHQTRVPPEWVDYNGHMNESRYLQVASDASDAVLDALNCGAKYAATGRSFFTAETHIRHLAEAFAGDLLRVKTIAIGGDEKRLHLFHELRKAEESDPNNEKSGDKNNGGEKLVATAEHMLLHVDSGLGKVVPAKGATAKNILRLVSSHSDIPRPEGVGAKVGRKS